MKVIAEYSYQWNVNQNKVTVGFLEITLFIRESEGQVYWRKKSVFSVIASKSFKSSLFDIFRTRLELKAWSP